MRLRYSGVSSPTRVTDIGSFASVDGTHSRKCAFRLRKPKVAVVRIRFCFTASQTNLRAAAGPLSIGRGDRHCGRPQARPRGESFAPGRAGAEQTGPWLD